MVTENGFGPKAVKITESGLGLKEVKVTGSGLGPKSVKVCRKQPWAEIGKNLPETALSQKR